MSSEGTVSTLGRIVEAEVAFGWNHPLVVGLPKSRSGLHANVGHRRDAPPLDSQAPYTPAGCSSSPVIVVAARSALPHSPQSRIAARERMLFPMRYGILAITCTT